LPYRNNLFFVDRNKLENRINANPEYGIVKITFFRPSRLGNHVGISNSSGDNGSVEYFFINNGDTIINRYGNNFGRIPKSIECLGKTFLVAFNSKNPKDNRILVDKPINDSTDFDILELTGKNPIY
jgi:hypothetical protein